MPPERRYRPIRTLDGSVLGTFFFVFATVFAMLWLSASLLPVFLLVTAYFARTFVQRASHTAAVQQNQTAVNLLNAGRVDDAAHIFDRLTQTERNTPAHAVYVFNRAVAYMLQGRPRRAYSLFNAVLRSHAFHFGFSHMYLPLLYVEVATCLALMGEVQEARTQRGEALKVLQEHEHGRLVFLDALLLVRQGHFGAVDDLARNRWRQAESLLRAPTLKALKLVHAFALAKLGQQNSREFRGLVDSVRPGKRGDFEWVGAEWAEFRTFLRDNAL
jgi:tetratricopeptide (TPR) repeat protein